MAGRAARAGPGQPAHRVWAVRQAWGHAAGAVVDVPPRRSGCGRTRSGSTRSTTAPLDGSDRRRLLPGSTTTGWPSRAERAPRRRVGDRGASRDAPSARARREAVRCSQQVCRLAPLDEGAHRTLLDRLLRAGDQAAAVVAAREFSRAAALRARRAPVAGDPGAHARAAAGEPRSARPACSGAPELRGLTAAGGSAADGAGQVVVLTGEAGIGKTSLLAELVHRVGAAGGRTRWARVSTSAGETPFAVWLELATGWSPRSRRSPADGRLAAGVQPALRRSSAPGWATRRRRRRHRSELERLRVFESVLRLVEWSCADRPALLASTTPIAPTGPACG